MCEGYTLLGVLVALELLFGSNTTWLNASDDVTIEHLNLNTADVSNSNPVSNQVKLIAQCLDVAHLTGDSVAHMVRRRIETAIFHP